MKQDINDSFPTGKAAELIHSCGVKMPAVMIGNSNYKNYTPITCSCLTLRTSYHSNNDRKS